MKITRQVTISFIRILALLVLFLSPRLPAAPNTPDKFAVPSPDGKFIFRQMTEWNSDDGEAAFGVIDASTRRSVLIDPGATLPPMEDSIACLWAPDSKRFAVNARVAGRHESTELFEWNGKNFRHIPSIEETIAGLLTADRQAQLKKAGVPENAADRHIWDTYKTLKWEAPDTLEVLASSTRSYELKKAPQDATRIVSAFIFTLKLETNARPKIIAQTTVPAEVSGR